MRARLNFSYVEQSVRFFVYLVILVYLPKENHVMQMNIQKIADKLRANKCLSPEHKNLSRSERIVSTAFGIFMVWKGAKDVFNTPSNAVWELILGAGLLYRGRTGYCAFKETLEDAPTRAAFRNPITSVNT